MKYKLYAAKYADHEDIQEAIETAKTYLAPLPVEFSPVEFIQEKETNKSLYEEVIYWVLSAFTEMKSIRTDYLESLKHEGCNGVILFINKKKAKESSNLYGEHTGRNYKSYMEVYVTKKYISMGVSRKTGKYGEFYTGNNIGAIRSATSHALIHEVFHSLSFLCNVPDILHTFIEEGQFENYKGYLQANIKLMNNTSENRERLYETAISCLGTDVTPKDLVPDNVACAETVNAVYAKAFGKSLGGGASTYLMYNSLLKHPDFTQVLTPLSGDIVISPTGYSRNGGKTVPNGHVGIVGENETIMSNDSPTGLFKANYSIKGWTDRYVIKGGYPMVFFRRK